jgi:hypothetical protein
VLNPLSTNTWIIPSFTEQLEFVVLIATLVNEFGVNKLTLSYVVQRPASVTKNEYDPEVSPVKLTDDPNVISTWPVEALKKYGGVPFITINSTSPSF